jgi:hypothetical protein
MGMGHLRIGEGRWTRQRDHESLVQRFGFVCEKNQSVSRVQTQNETFEAHDVRVGSLDQHETLCPA